MTTTTVTVNLKETASAGFKKIASAVSKAASAANQAGESFAGLGKSIGKAGASAVKSGKAIGGGIGKGATAAAAGIQNLDAKLSELSLSGSFAGGALQTIATGLFEFSAASLEAFGSAQRLGTATDGLAKSVGLVGDELVDAIVETSGGTVDALAAMEAANKALSFGVIKSTKDMEILTKTAKVLGPALGQSVAKALDDVTLGLGRNSKMILDNLGILVSATIANEKYAESHGLIASKLTDEQKSIAFRTEALAQMEALTEKIGVGEEGLADKTEKSAAAFVNFKIAIGALLEQPAGEFFDEISVGLQKLTEGAQALTESQSNFEILGQILEKATIARERDLGILHLQTEAIEENSSAFVDAQDAITSAAVSLIKWQQGEENIAEAVADVNQTIEIQNMLLAREEQALADATAETANYTAQTIIAAEAVDALTKSQSAQSARLTGLAAQFGAEPVQLNPIERAQTITNFFANEEAKKEAKAGTEKLAKSAAKDFGVAIEREFDQVEGLTGQVLGEAFGALGDLGLDFLSEDTGRAVAEDARRLAAIATGDFTGEAAKLLEQSNPELFAKVMASEDPAAVAQGILKDFKGGIDQFGLIDREAAKERIKNIFLGGQAQDSLIQELTAEVAKELGVGIAQVQAAVSGELGGATEEISATLPADEVLQQTDLIKSELEQIGIAGQETANMLDDSMTSITDNLFLVEEGGLRIKAIFLDIAAAAGSMTGAISGASSAVGIPNAAAGDSGGGGSASANAGGSFLAVGSNAGANLGGSSLVANAGNQAPATTAQQTRPMIINLTMESGGQAMATWVSGEIGEDITQQAQVTGKDPRF